jgi:tetratricopeptide (TPR) repeat protein
MDCARVKAEGIAEHYLLGTLAEVEQEAFEEHLVGCTTCYEEVANLCALKAELERSREQIVTEGAVRPSTWRRPWVFAVAAAVVAVAAGLGVWMRLEPTSAIRPELAELAAIVPPEYAPVRLRGSEDEAARRFREAMELYSRSDWQGALPGLRAASDLDPEAPQIAFYLGACALLAGETDEAITQLQRTVDLGDTPFLEEALFYVAKAHLREGGVTAARDALDKVILLNGDRSQEAQSLLDRLDALGGR